MKNCESLSVLILAVAVMAIGCQAAYAQGTVTLDASSDCYAVGDTVRFTLANGLDSTIYMPYSPVWSVWCATGDTLVFPNLVYWVTVPLGPDTSETYTWPQIDYHLNQVSQGPYWVEVTYSPQLVPWNPSFTVTDSFYVGGASAAEPSTWGSIKALCR